MPPRPPRPRRQHGFTLVEVLSVAAMASVVLSVAVPSLRTLIDSVAVTSAANDLLGDLYLARSNAVNRRQRVAVCRSADGDSCAASGGWEQGWLVFVDTDNDGLRTVGEPLLHRQQALRSSVRLSGNSPVASYVSYASDGASKLAGGGFQSGTLTICAASEVPVTGRQIIIGSGGRPRVQKVRLASCG